MKRIETIDHEVTVLCGECCKPWSEVDDRKDIRAYWRSGTSPSVRWTDEPCKKCVVDPGWFMLACPACGCGVAPWALISSVNGVPAHPRGCCPSEPPTPSDP